MRKRSLLSNSGIVLSTQVWSVFLSLFTTPYIIKKLGTDAYGILSLIVVLSGYLSFLDMGFGYGLIKYIAEFQAQDDKAAINKSLATSLFIFFYLGLVASALLIFSAGWLTGQVFHIPPNLIANATFAIRISAATFLITFLVSVYSSFLKGFQRFDLSNITQSFFTSCYALGAVGLLYLKKGLIEIVWLSFVLSGLALIVHMLLAKRLVSDISWFPRFHKPYFRILMGFSFFSMLSRFGMIAIFHIDKFFVSYFFPIAMLAYYVVPFNLAQKLNFMGSNIANVVMPYVSEKMSLNQMEAFQQTYYKAAKAVWLLTLAPTLVVIIFADKILRLWISPAFSAQGAVPLMFLAAGFFLISVASLDASSTDGVGKPHINALFFGTTGLLNLLLCSLLTKAFGILGTSLALFTCFLCLSVANILFFNHYILRAKLSTYLLQTIYPCGKLMLVAIPVLFFIKIFITNLISLIILCVVSLITILFLGLFLFYDQNARNLIKVKVWEYLALVGLNLRDLALAISVKTRR